MSDTAATTSKTDSRSAQVRAELAARTPKSAAISSEASDVLALEVVQTFEMPHPIYIESTEGSRVTDVDGNSYIDLTMGFGPHLLGHRPKVIEDAMAAQIKKGWHVGLHNPLQAELAELLNEAARCGEQTIFCNSGTEATMYGMRVARGFTGKDKVAVFDGNYHGSHDYALIKAAPDSPRDAPLGRILGRGVPDVVNDNTMMVLPYHDEAAYGLIRAHANQLALVIVQPVQNQVPRNDNAEFLHGLLDVCRECGVLMLMDEVVTGFRISYGGGQETYDITPDLATYGKALAGGMPIGALTGRADVMELFGLGKGDPRGVFSGGTFSGNPLTMAAGIAALHHMRDNKETIYPTLNRKSQRMADAINGFCQENQIGAQLLNTGSIFYLHFQREPIETSRDVTNTNTEAEREYYLHLMNHGVIVPGIHLFFLSDAHSDEDVDEIVEAFKQSFLDVRADGLM
ncbi:MAG: aspartate aminotransferase family protein [Alphaproteobacteria bacterium]